MPAANLTLNLSGGGRLQFHDAARYNRTQDAHPKGQGQTPTATKVRMTEGVFLTKVLNNDFKKSSSKNKSQKNLKAAVA